MEAVVDAVVRLLMNRCLTDFHNCFLKTCDICGDPLSWCFGNPNVMVCHFVKFVLDHQPVKWISVFVDGIQFSCLGEGGWNQQIAFIKCPPQCIDR